MAPKLYDLATADEDQRSCATKPVGLYVSSTTFIKPSAMDRHAEFDAHCGSNNNVISDELVAEYLRESAKRLDVCWAEIGPLGSASALVLLGTWLSEMADGLMKGWACRLINAAAELKKKSHPAQRVIKAYNGLQRRRLTRLCRAAGLRNPSMLADALLLLFDGACVMAPSVDRNRLSFRFLRLSEAMIAAHAKAPSARRQVQHP